VLAALNGDLVRVRVPLHLGIAVRGQGVRSKSKLLVRLLPNLGVADVQIPEEKGRQRHFPKLSGKILMNRGSQNVTSMISFLTRILRTLALLRIETGWSPVVPSL
jgi:hypothetical protein